MYTNEKGHCCNLHKDILPTFVKRRGMCQWFLYPNGYLFMLCVGKKLYIEHLETQDSTLRFLQIAVLTKTCW